MFSNTPDSSSINANDVAPLPDGSLLAALDLGSNSFHLLIGRLEHGEIKPVHTLAEKVQLGAGLNGRTLSQGAIERGLACLKQFAQLLQSVEPSRIRVVGTHALRRANNRQEFTRPAEQILGVPIDVVYGREEARLVYLGVAHALADDERSRLVVDIGGGSTEFIVGRRFEPTRLESLQLGCVSYANTYFPNGKISKRRFCNAYEQAMIEVSHIRKHYSAKHWSEAVGSSGTLQAIEALIRINGWSHNGIDRTSLERLRKSLLKYKHADEIPWEGLNDKRRQVLAAGVAIALAIFRGLDIEKMRTSKGALREGVVYDLVGRLRHEDVRERSIGAILARYNADPVASAGVATTVRDLSTAVGKVWGLGRRDIELLVWAGRCHAIGVGISQKHYNRHSAYLLENSDLPGFSQGEQELLATLVNYQRGKLRQNELNAIRIKHGEKVVKMLAIVRLAVVLKWAEDLEGLQVKASSISLHLCFSAGWYKNHPLTTKELSAASTAIKKLGLQLQLD
ncbi:MAG: Ppx/GppA phosphatase family protein [Luminiphilus sp.]|nr:Ppx/GppA phosphatase family protein [Luminiphilus sp.]